MRGLLFDVQSSPTVVSEQVVEVLELEPSALMARVLRPILAQCHAGQVH